MPIIRVSVIRCQPQDFPIIKQMMADSLAVLQPGISRMRGLIHFHAGEDEATSSLVNVSFWETLADAKQVDTFQPMLDLGKAFVAKGATFERPIMNYAPQWDFGPQGS